MAATGKFWWQTLSIVLIFMSLSVISSDAKKKNKADDITEADKWKKKDVRDYSDADMERLFEQWEDGDEELEEDELPEWKRPQPKVDLSKLDPNNPEAMLKATKKGRTLMMFASVSGDPTEKETEEITKIWQTSLFNANMEVQRYIVGANRVLFMLKDGSYAWDIRDFLITQERCESVTIEGQDYPGKGSDKYQESKKPQTKPEKSKKKKKAQKKKVKKEEENRAIYDADAIDRIEL